MKLMYNVTISIDPAVEKQWTSWMIDNHIPDVMSTGKFLNYSMQKVLAGNPKEGITYAIQYVAASREIYEKYQQEDAPKLQAEHDKKFRGYYGAFRTLMEIVSHS